MDARRAGEDVGADAGSGLIASVISEGQASVSAAAVVMGEQVEVCRSRLIAVEANSRQGDCAGCTN